MTRTRILTLVVSAAILLTPWVISHAAELSGEFLAGYGGGPTGQLALEIADFTESLPIEARLGVDYAGASPGKAQEARAIFINNATNGTPEKRAWSWSYRFDLVYPLESGSDHGFRLFGGPRCSRYTANFRYVGGNEDFDVRSRQWGWGMGLETDLAMGSATSLRVSGGLDYFLESDLTGHDTSYSPDGEYVNPREEYTYEDADRAIDQPGLVPRIVLGIAYRFGGPNR